MTAHDDGLSLRKNDFRQEAKEIPWSRQSGMGAAMIRLGAPIGAEKMRMTDIQSSRASRNWIGQTSKRLFRRLHPLELHGWREATYTPFNEHMLWNAGNDQSNLQKFLIRLCRKPIDTIPADSRHATKSGQGLLASVHHCQVKAKTLLLNSRNSLATESSAAENPTAMGKFFRG